MWTLGRGAVELLLANGADPNEANRGFPALACAANRGHVNVVRVLVEAGADLGARNAPGHTPVKAAQLVWGGGMAPGLKFKERERFAKEGEVTELVRKMWRLRRN